MSERLHHGGAAGRIQRYLLDTHFIKHIIKTSRGPSIVRQLKYSLCCGCLSDKLCRRKGLLSVPRRTFHPLDRDLQPCARWRIRIILNTHGLTAFGERDDVQHLDKGAVNGLPRAVLTRPAQYKRHGDEKRVGLCMLYARHIPNYLPI